MCLNSNDEISAGLTKVLNAMIEINTRRQTMWKASNPKNYNNFRTFIMGIQGNSDIFGDGVVYEGVSEEPRQYRGQSGAMDDIIPTMDIFSGVVDLYPNNMLTSYLLDLRSYRPKCVQEFFADLRVESPKFLKVVRDSREYSILLLQIIEQIYLFRNGHWQFIQKYIMANTKYPVATGGTPITSWVPNQIEAVLKAMKTIIDALGESIPSAESDYQKVVDRYTPRVMLLKKQLDELRSIDYNVDRIYDLNREKDDTISFI